MDEYSWKSVSTPIEIDSEFLQKRMEELERDMFTRMSNMIYGDDANVVIVPRPSFIRRFWNEATRRASNVWYALKGGDFDYY